MGQPVTIWYVTYNFDKCNVATLIRYDCHANFKDLSDTKKRTGRRRIKLHLRFKRS